MLLNSILEAINELSSGELLIATFILGSIVGSFLNVIIYRLPIMMENEYKEQAHEILEIPFKKPLVFNLTIPNSCCRECNRPIRFYENIPLISYLVMRGKCRGCGCKISIFYPIVELITAILSTFIIYHFGVSAQGGFALLFIWFLIPLVAIDLKVQLLPDIMTIPLMWIGILSAFIPTYIPLKLSIAGAVLGYLLLWSIATLFKVITKRDGMGLGDAKLLAAICAWVSIYYLPIILLVACFSGILVTLIQKIIQNKKMINRAIPFGPYLSLGGIISFLYGEPILDWYTRILLGLH